MSTGPRLDIFTTYLTILVSSAATSKSRDECRERREMFMSALNVDTERSHAQKSMRLIMRT